eukprot:43235_1
MTTETSSFHEEIPLLPPAPTDVTGSTKSERATFDDTPIDEDATPQHKYSLFVAICFSLNYSIGSGILGLPYEYFQSGYILGSLSLIYLGVLTYITYTFVMNGMQRAEAITSLSHHFGMTRHKLLTDPEYTKGMLSGTSPQTLRSLYGYTRNEYQLSELIGMFCGKRWKICYDVFYGISLIIALWSYSALFGISLARNIGIPGISDACDITEGVTAECRGLYSLYVCIFWIWTVIITSMDFTEQQGIQVGAAVARICIISLMIITSIGLIYSSWAYDGSEYVMTSPTAEYAKGVSAWKWSGMAYMIAVSAFAYGNQYCVTDIIQPLSVADRQKQHELWSLSILICAIVYVLSGITISLYFGNTTESPCTLGWKGFMGFEYTETQPVWAVMIAWCIVLFPAIDIASAYPLNAGTLANTLEAAFMPKNITHRSLNPIHAMTVQSSRSRWYKIVFRVLVCTITAILALIEWNFDLILAVSGAFGLLAVYGGPCILEWKSRQYMKEITNHTDPNVHVTPQSKSWTYHRSWIFITCVTSLLACIAVFVDIIETYA